MKWNYHELILEWKRQLELGLKEDRVQEDWTTQIAVNQDPHRWVEAKIVAKSGGVWVGQHACSALKECSHLVESEFQSNLNDGDSFEPGTELCTWRSSALEILGFERTFLNLVSFLGGIATRTQNFKKIIGNFPIDLLSTRKNLPGLRDLSLYAVSLGGGKLHRRDLGSGILIKENHIDLAGSIESVLKDSKKHSPHLFKIEIEVKNKSELKQALDNGADVVMLDNFKPSEVQEALESIETKQSVYVEVSGGINEDTIENYLIKGVNGISVGGLTHSVQSLDLSLLLNI